MATGRSSRVKEIFLQAVELAPSERGTFLAEACADDAALHEQVDALLAANDESGDGFLDPPAPEFASAVVKTWARKEGNGQSPPLGFKPGDLIGRYRLLERLGEGGFGDIYLAEQEEPVERRVALKVIKLGMDTRQVVARFEAERQALAMMDHPNIARVYDTGATPEGRPYFVMEYVDGLPITEYCDRDRMSIRDRLLLFLQVCNAVQHAHLKGIIHRDIKPSNVLVARDDGDPVPKVIDFGIAKAIGQHRLTEKTLQTDHKQFIGTPGYMSPEQAAMTTLDIDTRTDIYSLGVLLYELLVGASPFDIPQLREAGFNEARRTICEEEPPRPSSRLNTLDGEATRITEERRTDFPALYCQIRGDLDWIPMRAMEKDRARRYPTVSELASDINRHLSDEPVVASPPSAVYRTKKFVKKHRAPVLGVAAVLLVLALGLVASTVLYFRARDAIVDLYTTSGLAADKLENPAEAVLWFANAARLSRSRSDRQSANRARLRAWSGQCPRPIASF